MSYGAVRNASGIVVKRYQARRETRQLPEHYNCEHLNMFQEDDCAGHLHCPDCGFFFYDDGEASFWGEAEKDHDEWLAEELRDWRPDE